jgi:homopolymeric O-antigen transport system permease protein
MKRVINEPDSKPGIWHSISPFEIVRGLWAHREVIGAFAAREFQAAHRGTFLGLIWTVISPLFMLAVFAFVFGYVFNGRFATEVPETPLDYALALFVGISFFNCIGQSLGNASTLILANASYVKTNVFPLEIIPVASVLNILFNLAIGIGLCTFAFFVTHGFIHVTAVFLLPLVASIGLMALGTSWLLSSLALFVRDIPAIIPPVVLVLMFMSGVFFPIEFVPPRVRIIVLLNPIAVIIDQARDALLYGHAPAFIPMFVIFCLSLSIAILGYFVFVRARPAFADVV